MANEIILRNGFRSLGSGSLDGKLTVNNILTVTGATTAASFTKVGASADDILLGNGTTTSLAALSPSSVSGLVTGSSQISYPLISDIPVGIVSGSSQLNGTTINNLSLTNVSASGSFSGSFFGDGSQLSGVTSYTNTDTLNYINSINVISGSSQIDHDATTNFVANEHIDWTTDQGATNIHSGNYTDTNTVTRLNGTGGTLVSGDVLIQGTGLVSTSQSGQTITIATTATSNVGTVTSVTAGNGMTQSGTSTINPTLNVVSHAGSAGTIGTINIGADAIGVDLGSTSTTAAPGNHTHATLYEPIASGTHILFSGSSQVNADTITNFDTNVLTYINSIAVASGSGYLKNTTDTLTGDLTVTGIITAQEFHTEFISSSIIYQSGSTKFGDTSDDQHQFTGSVSISGSLSTTSNTLVTNLNSDLLDSQHGAYYLSYPNFTNLPTLVSGSSQITYSGISSIPAGIVSGAVQITPLLPTGTVSGSSQVSFTTISNKPTLVSGSSQVVYAQLSSIPAGIISSSAQVNADTITNFDANVLTYINSQTVVSGSSQLNNTTISGLTISTSATIGGATPQTSVNLAQQANAAVTTGGLRDIATITTTGKIGAHIDYGVLNGTNCRVGTVMIAWNGATQPVISDNSTSDMGDTSGVSFSALYVNATTVKLQVTTTTSTWDIRTFVRTI